MVGKRNLAGANNERQSAARCLVACDERVFSVRFNDAAPPPGSRAKGTRPVAATERPDAGNYPMRWHALNVFRASENSPKLRAPPNEIKGNKVPKIVFRIPLFRNATRRDSSVFFCVNCTISFFLSQLTIEASNFSRWQKRNAQW